MRRYLSRLSALVAMTFLPSCGGADIDKGLRLGNRVYNFDHHPKAGLIVADYSGQAVRILPDPIARPKDRIEIREVMVDRKPLPLNFPHTASWLDATSFALTLSKLNAADPKLQGMTLIVDAAARTAVRIDDIFADRAYENFPDYVGPCDGRIAASYAYFNAVIVFEPDGRVLDLIGEKATVLPRLRSQVAAQLRNVIDVPLSNPHGIACTGNAMFVADTGHGRILRIKDSRVAFLHRTGDSAFAWQLEASATPAFKSPVAVRAIDGALYFNDFETGDLFKVDAAAPDGAPIEGARQRFRSEQGAEPVKFFDFLRIDSGWLINLGTTGTIRRMRDS